ncbi:MAG: hypothetical protein V4675_18665 [Verrucomicrobiota bacterium]
MTVLSNGNYVVNSPHWTNGSAARAGAVTWGNGNKGMTGVVSIVNSLVGGQTDDRIGSTVGLSNGNYLVVSRFWKNQSAAAAGSVTWGNGNSGVAGKVSPMNSLVGSHYFDNIGYSYSTSTWGVMELRNGHYIVNSPDWGSAGIGHIGAFTWGNGTAGVVGEVSAANSLLGTTTGATSSNRVSVDEMEGGLLVVRSDNRANGGLSSAGAITLFRSDQMTAGITGIPNTVLGTVAGFGSYMGVAYDAPRARVIVHHRSTNLFTVLSLGNPILTDWHLDNFGEATAGTGYLEDFDSDGVQNLMEFAFGTSADEGSSGNSGLEYMGSLQGGGTLVSTGLPVIERQDTPGGAELRALFTRRRDYLMAGLNYIPQFSTDLNSWQDSSAAPLVLAWNDSHQVVSVPWPSVAGGPPPRFFRISVNVTDVNWK